MAINGGVRVVVPVEMTGRPAVLAYFSSWRAMTMRWIWLVPS